VIFAIDVGRPTKKIAVAGMRIGSNARFDINMHRWRYAYRIGADMVGTHYFGSNQFSPKFSTGFVYKF